MYILRQYLTTLADPHGLTRTLGDLKVCRDAQGCMCYTVGNSAVVFRVLHGGRIRSLRCYTRPARHAEVIYGERLLKGELYLYTTPDTGEWVDVVLDDWIEGITLSEAIRSAVSAHDTSRLQSLAHTFDRLAAKLTCDNWAHGDLKPDNIILSSDGKLHLIDFDAQFLPAFNRKSSPELGTAAFQHPSRTVADFNPTLDDYPAALISTALHALALDPQLYARYTHNDGLLFNPARIATDPALNEALALFERTGAAVQYRIARLLLSPSIRLFGLGELLAYAVQRQHPTPRDPNQATPELYVEHGLWGFRTPTHVVIPPLYDSGFDFTEGLAAIRLGSTWHYIDLSGEVAICCPNCDAVKPFHNGWAEVISYGKKWRIDPTGRIFDI